MLRLLNLLYHRTAVSRATVAAECGISERSTYRYLRSLSEAGFPVYWDDHLKGYRLNSQKMLALESFDVADIAMMAMAIVSLKRRCGSDYDSLIEGLYRKLMASVSIPIDDVFRSLESTVLACTESAHSRTLLTRLIVQAAAVSKLPIHVRVKKLGTGSLEYVLREPQLVLAEDWQIIDAASTKREPLPLASVTAARVATLRLGVR